ncbi:uncharacterized protein LOC108099036 [Drosophila ficusphila]|uniref:uncharacterized protein LOC108099036 n=1 Tax=Drosophila ficusphila TaxID=30025 RepID=UPI0007E5D1AA|nr:uncharacterized protein LOC108099036 [Drosophila ficusphila]
MPNFWKILWRVVDSFTDPPKRPDSHIIMGAPISHLSIKKYFSLGSSGNEKNSHIVMGAPISKSRVKKNFSLGNGKSSSHHARYLVPYLSRHVHFSPSTLEHQSYRKAIMNAETISFQNFMREMYDGYYELVLSQNLSTERLGLKGLKQLQKLAKDMWKTMDWEWKQKYKDLAKKARHRQSLRLPPDPFRIPLHIRRSSKKLMKTISTI